MRTCFVESHIQIYELNRTIANNATPLPDMSFVVILGCYLVNISNMFAKGPKAPELCFADFAIKFCHVEP